MATGFEYFERDLKVATAGLEPQAINAAVAAFAKRELARAISSGAASRIYDRYVNSVHGAPEESYKAPGAIIYEFSNWPLIIATALEELRRRSPRLTGLFSESFLVIVNGRMITEYHSIPADAVVTITNAQPYVRRIEGGKKKGQKRVFDSSKNALARRFKGAFRFETRWLTLGAGIHPLIPYTLRSSRSGRKDRQAGATITYPAIIISRGV